jgi:hypothetical protein
MQSPIQLPDFPARLPIILGLGTQPIAKQVSSQGLVLDNPEQWERRHQAWNILRIGGFLTPTETMRIHERLVRGISGDAHYDTARHNLGQELLAELSVTPEDVKAATETKDDALAEARARIERAESDLERYIAMTIEKKE